MQLGYYKEKGDQRQSDVDAAMMKYAGLLEEKEVWCLMNDCI